MSSGKNHEINTILILMAMSAAMYSWASPSLDYVLSGGLGGNEKIGKYIYDGKNLPQHYPVLIISRDPTSYSCYMKNDRVSVHVVNAKAGNPVVQFLCPDLDNNSQIYWNNNLEAVNGSYSPANDAMYAGEVVSSMYLDWFHVPVLKLYNTILEKQKPLVLHIHDWGGSFAYWDGESAYFGDGDQNNYFPFVSLTIISHEVSHGFTQQYSQLNYTLESGAVNESFSDMASKAAEYYMVGYNRNWELADEVMKSDRAYRYMDNPSRDCIDLQDKKHCSIEHVKDYNSELNVHYTSGIFNKVFYLLATAPNWNTRKAFEVMVQANMSYWTSTTTFYEAACGVIAAAKDYDYDQQTIVKVFENVGITTVGC